MKPYEILIIAIAVAAACGVLYLIKKKNETLFKNIVLALVVKAEKYLGSGTGELKYATVVNWIYSKVPVSVRWLFTQNDIDKFIEWAVDYMKKYLSDGKYNLSGYDDEAYFNKLINENKKVDG